jgi:SAM-dependent methyltransferase
VPPLPLPPEALMRRVGWNVYSSRPGEVYVERGREQWRLIKSLLPEGWSFEGKRVLDFGCGAGRIVRHALAEDPAGEYWGCDIDAASIEWLRANLSPPLHAFQTDEWPPTSEPDGRFDLVYAFSVFTHLLDPWSAWLVELHRLLADEGIAIVTVFGPGAAGSFDGFPVGEEINGMNVLGPATDWERGGPLIVHSEWWLRAHWGRAFEILELLPGGPTGPPMLFGQGVVVMRKRPGRFTTAELEALEPGEPREIAALQANVASLRREASNQAEAIRIYESSRSWRLTAPLRAIAGFARKRR